jgi:VanZ family protein
MNRVVRRPGRWWPTWIVAGLILVTTLAPAPWRNPSRSPPLSLDKVYHFVMHAVLTVALVDGTERPETSAVSLAVVASAVYGLLLEAGQTRVPGRQYEQGDVVAGALGALVGGVAVTLVPGSRRTSRPTGTAGGL